MNLNLGCGEYRRNGWVNVDATRNKHVQPDVVADITEPLPFDTDSADRVYLGHVLEHIDLQEGVPAVLAEVKRVLAPGGEVMAVGPDVNRARETGDLRLIQGAVHGAKRWPGDEHLWECEEALLVKALADAGFKDPQPVALATLTRTHPGWPLVSPAGWQAAAYGWVGA